MRSATSFFDKTLFRSQLKHTWPLWLGYTALWLFLVPVMLFSELSAYQLGYSAADASRLLLNTGVRGGIFISFFFGLFFAMLSFSHLTQSRATNGFHALPVRRETIFLTAYLTGLFCQLSTILVTFLLGAAVSAPLHLSFWSVTAAAMGSAMLEAVFFYSFAALCMVMTGQILAAPVFYFVGNILVPGMEYLLRNFAGNFLYGYSGQTDVALDFLSPPLYMYFKVGIASIETCESDSYYVTAYALVRGSLMILAAYALAGLVIALIALLLYRTRKSEMTGSTVAFPWAVPVFKYGVAFCTASTALRSAPPFRSASSSTISSSASTARAATIPCPARSSAWRRRGLWATLSPRCSSKRASVSSARAQRARPSFRSLLCCSALR